MITNDTDLGALSAVWGTWGIVWYILIAIALWKVFTKAEYPGWFALIPVLNFIILVRVAGMNALWALLYLIPIVNFIFAIVIAFKVGGAFGKGGVFSFFFLWLIPFVGYLIIGFGDAKYRRPV